MPLRRMKAITTSMASAESISASSWLSRPGSPGAFVSSVVSSSGISGSAIGWAVPSGRRSRIACSTSPGSTGASDVSVSTNSASRAMRSRATSIPTRTRSLSLTAARDRSIWRLRCSAIRSAASAVCSARCWAERLSRESSCVRSVSVVT